jgi:hypothetical protein
MAKYTRQIVVFMDILGFSNMLPDFEHEALENDTIGQDGYHEATSVNHLLKIFNDAVKLVKNANCRAYQFSDNLCITINYVVNDTENPELFVEIPRLISLLMFEFVKAGYFLRGGVDAGWFLDADDIAIGVPLVNAYRLESQQAIFPRILFSENFIGQLRQYGQTDRLSDNGAFLAAHYIAREAELGYLNSFFHITNFDDKEGKIDYLRTYSKAIGNNLGRFKGDSRIEPKYAWLAGELNQFIDRYLDDHAYLEIDDDQLDYSNEDISLINSFKINLNAV